MDNKEKMLLTDPVTFPSPLVLRDALKESYETFNGLITAAQEPPLGLQLQWRYYNDSKAWLGKLTHNKKTIFWLSVWDQYFCTTFLFTQKHIPGIEKLDIQPELKHLFFNSKPVGRLIPLLVKIKTNSQLHDVFTIIKFKME